MKLFESPLRSVRAAAVVASALAALVSANSLTNDFAYDDVPIIVENAAIHDLATLPEALTTPYWPGRWGRELGLWRPTTTLALALQYAAVGENAVVFHLVNVLLHAGVTALGVVLLAHLMALPGAFVAGLVFAVHPVHVEAVANVVGLGEVLPGLLFLWACLLHIRGPGRTGWGRALGLGLLYALAFGGKESAVTLPGAIFLLDAARGRLALADLPAYVRDRWRAYVVMALVAGALLLGRFHVLGNVASPFGPLGATLLEEIPRIWTVAELWSHYVRLLVFPLDLSSDYSPNVVPISLGWNARNVVGLGLALGILAGALVAWRRPPLRPDGESARIVAFGVVWFVVTISPVTNLLFLTGVLLAERTLYIPSLGFAAVVGWMAMRMARERPRAVPVALVAALLLLGWRSWERNPTWKDNDTVFLTLIDEHPHSGRSQWVLGDMFYKQGNVSQALVSYRVAVGLLGSSYQVVTEIAKKLMAAKHYRAAEHLLRSAWRDHPGFALAPGQLGVLYYEERRPEETERHCRLSLALGGPDAVCSHLLAWALSEQERWAEAAQARRAAIEAGEGRHWQQWVSLAWLEGAAGDTTAALVALDSAAVRVREGAGARQVDSLRAELTPREPGAGVPVP